jgi:D-glycero-D-manno-heptose 1,7-bisphosphate phosphatase
MKRRRAVFLDRDGTLNQDVGYPAHWSQLHIYPFAFEAVRRFRRAGMAVVVVTNQSGVGRGAFTEEDLRALHRSLAAAFEDARARLDGIYSCPHYCPPAADPEAGACSCGKPNPAMGMRAAAELALELPGSYVVGDKASDILFGLNIGAVPVLVLTGYGRQALREVEASRVRAAHVAENLAGAADWILGREKRGIRKPRRGGPANGGGHDPL